MIVYNRRKRAIYFQEQEKEQARILQFARDAVAQGSATPAQIQLVEGIREEELAMEKKKTERKVGSRILWWLNGSWKEDKELEEQRKLAVREAQLQQAQAQAQAQAAQPRELGITQAVQEARVNGTAQSGLVVGGPLDQAAANAAGTSKGWLGWAFGGSKKSE